MEYRVRVGWCTMLLLALWAVPGLAQSGSLIGRVTNAETAGPVSGARVEVTSLTGQVLTGTLSGDDGRFRIANVAPGSYLVVVRMIGYDMRQIEGVQVGADAPATLDVQLTPRAVALDQIVVSASKRVERALDAPARVEVVGQREVEERPTVTMADHLRNTPGVDIASSGVQSTNVVTRGFNNIFSGALNVLTDHRIAGVPSLRVNFLHFLPTTNEDVERMEVVLGPGAALYGPNTANGVLHIFTRSPLVHQGTTVSLTGGERSLFHGAFRTSHLLSENFGVKLSGQYFRADEWEHRDPVEVAERQKFASDPFWRQDMINAFGLTPQQADERIARIGLRNFDLDRWSGELRADWRVSPDATAVLTTGVSNATGIELTGLGAGQVENWRSVFYQLRANWRNLFGQVYLNTSDAGNTYLLRNGAPIIDHSKLLVAQLQHRTLLGERQAFTYGLDYLHTMPETEGTINGGYEDDDETREFGGYLQSETALSPQFDLVLAGRVDTHSALPEAIFSPRAALVFKPGANQALRVSFNRAFSTPTSLTQFLDLPSSSPNPDLARLGYSLRVQGTGRDGFAIRQPDGSYQMRSPFNPQQQGGPRQLLPANAIPLFYPAAVQVVAQVGQLPAPVVDYLLQLSQQVAAQVGTSYFHPATDATGSLAALELPNVAPIREETQTTIEFGYKGIIADRLLLAADVWRSRRQNLITPLTIQTPLLLLNGQQLGALLVPRLMQDLGMSQQDAVTLATRLASVPLGVISAPAINANGAQLLVSYTNVDEHIDLYGTDLSATFLINDRWSLGATASLVDDDRFTTAGGLVVALNAPKRKGSMTLNYRDGGAGLNAEGRVRYSAGFPVSSGVYQGTLCLPEASQLFAEDCVDSFTLVDVNVGYRIPGFRQTSIQLYVQNLLDTGYRSFPGVPEIGRMALLRLRYEF